MGCVSKCVCVAHGSTSSGRSGGCVKWTRDIYSNDLSFPPGSKFQIGDQWCIRDDDDDNSFNVVGCGINRSGAY